MRAFILAVTGLAVVGVTACSSGGTSVMEVQKGPVASISLTLPAASLMRGQSGKATATPRDATGAPLYDRPVTWHSSAIAVASVDASGMISAVAPGTATISAASEGISADANMSVTDVPPVPVASVSVALGASSLNPGQTTQATATTRDVSNNILTGRAITWTSSNQGVATVSSTGLVSAVSVGTAQITATSEGQNGNATLTVTTVPPVPVASVSVSIASSSLNPGQTTQATAVTRDANNNVLTGRSISWISSNSSVATVSGTGLVRAVAAGTAQITATSEGQSGNATLTVVAVPVASVSVSLASSSLDPGQTTQAAAVTRDANNNVLTGRSIAWNSSNIAVATVSGAGVVTAVAVGTAQITATSEGQSGSATLTVAVTPPVPVASVTVSLASGSLYPGQTTQASAVTRDANNNVLTGRAITWSSSNQAVATVSPSGLVTAIAVGAVQILASCEAQSGSATLNVQPAGSSNEPAGMTVISERPFNALNELGWNDANGGGTIVTDATAPKSPSNVLQILLRAGFGEGGGPFAGDYTFSTNYRTIYVSYWAKYSSNWYGPSSNINKTFYLFTSLGAPSIVFDMDAGGNAPMQPVIAGQDILAGGIGGDAANPFWTPNLTTAIAARGQWHHIEFIVVGNTAGNRDGSIDWYLNGVHVGHYTGIQFQSGNTVWNMFHYTLLYTGTNNSNPPADQYNWWDHIYLSGKN